MGQRYERYFGRVEGIATARSGAKLLAPSRNYGQARGQDGENNCDGGRAKGGGGRHAV